MYTQSLLLLLLILLSGAFSGAEIALTSLSKAKVKSIENDQKFASKAIVQLKQKPQRLLIAILIGNNLVNIFTTVMATVWAQDLFKSDSIGIVTGALTFLILVFGEITPKTFAQKYNLSFARFIAYPLLALIRLFLPILIAFEWFTKQLFKALGTDQPLQSVSEDELLALVDIGAKEGVIEEKEQELIENVLEFTETVVEEVMTPKKDMEMLKIETTIEDAVHSFLQFSHSRIPIYKDSIHNIVGIISVHNILRLLHDESAKGKTLEDCSFMNLIVVPKTKSISALFHEFQNRRQHLAIVVDERGETVGLVTMEDILEEIVGDIVDEQDREENLIKAIGKNEWEADGEADVEEINEALNVELSSPEHHTIGLLILEKLNRFPKQGEKIVFENLIFKVKQMSKKKIEKVTITKVPESK